MKIELRVEGLDQIEKLLRDLSPRVSKNVQISALKEGAEMIRVEASARAPRAPGAPDLADNIGTTTVRGGVDGQPAVGIGVPKRFYYDTMQEFGTARNEAQAFYRPALDAKGEAAVRAIQRALWSALISRGVSTGRSSGGGTGL